MPVKELTSGFTTASHNVTPVSRVTIFAAGLSDRRRTPLLMDVGS